MNKFKSILIASTVSIFATVQVWSQTQSIAANISDSTVLTDKYGIRIYVTNINNQKDGKLNFSNSTDKNTIINWNVIDNNGKISYTGNSITLAPKLTMSVPLTTDLQNALKGKDSSVQFVVRN